MGSESRRIIEERENRIERYPDETIQFDLDMEFDTRFSRLVEKSGSEERVALKAKIKPKKRASRSSRRR